MISKEQPDQALCIVGRAITKWPDRSGIDGIKNIGREPSTVHGTIHGRVTRDQMNSITDASRFRSREIWDLTLMVATGRLGIERIAFVIELFQSFTRSIEALDNAGF